MRFGRQISACLAALLLAAPPGCASRSVHEGADAFARISALDPGRRAIEARPAFLAGVEVRGEDLHRPWDDRWLVWIPFVPFARSGAPVVRGHELGPEVERAVWPHFQNKEGQRRVVLRITIDEGREEEVRTAYGLSAVGVLLAAIVGAPLRFMEATAIADFELVDAGAPAGAKPILKKRIEAKYDAKCGVAALLYWYNTDVQPRDVMFEAWASALDELIPAIPAAGNPVWKASATVRKGETAR